MSEVEVETITLKFTFGHERLSYEKFVLLKKKKRGKEIQEWRSTFLINVRTFRRKRGIRIEKEFHIWRKC